MTVQTTRPTFDAPSAKEQERRDLIVDVARHFVLDGSHLSPPVQWTLGFQPAAPEAKQFYGLSRSAVRQMIKVYPTAGTNATTTALKSTYNIVRATVRSNNKGINLDTNVENPTPEAQAFGLAMKWFDGAITWAEQQLAEAGVAEASAVA